MLKGNQTVCFVLWYLQILITIVPLQAGVYLTHVHFEMQNIIGVVTIAVRSVPNNNIHRTTSTTVTHIGTTPHVVHACINPSLPSLSFVNVQEVND